MKDTNACFYAVNPATIKPLEGMFVNASAKEIEEAVLNATAAFHIFRKKDNNSIAVFLEQIAKQIELLGDVLLERCHLETGLPIARLVGERGRTMNQLRLFATVVREGSWVNARIDTAIVDRTPQPKPDIRHILQPLGPVVVFGASNFPLAFSTAGGDTVSALAAGCPVIVKGHESHPGTSELVANAILQAIHICNMPIGTFSLLQGNSNAVGEALVKHPGIKAVGFTGSYSGGKALFDLANSRPEPIPVFAEMGSTNPVFILPRILKEKGIEIGTGMANSIAMGVGQFCTKPGLIFVQKSEANNLFYNQIKSKISEVPSGNMLNLKTKRAFDSAINKYKSLSELVELAVGLSDDTGGSSCTQLFKTSLDYFNCNPSLAEENFGPSSIIVETNSKEKLLDVARSLKGQLTVTVFGDTDDFSEYKELFDILDLKAGRIVINGYPTGVEVCHSMVHGGPFPATTSSQSTSVGTAAINRFLRPVCFQDYPDSLLPDALKNENALNIWRMINGEMTKSSVL
jgi:alpha-ketoglutaric semialdehyde dehydrogenase